MRTLSPCRYAQPGRPRRRTSGQNPESALGNTSCWARDRQPAPQPCLGRLGHSTAPSPPNHARPLGCRGAGRASQRTVLRTPGGRGPGVLARLPVTRRRAVRASGRASVLGTAHSLAGLPFVVFHVARHRAAEGMPWPPGNTAREPRPGPPRAGTGEQGASAAEAGIMGLAGRRAIREPAACSPGPRPGVPLAGRGRRGCSLLSCHCWLLGHD